MGTHEPAVCARPALGTGVDAQSALREAAFENSVDHI